MPIETPESRKMFASVTGVVLVNADTGQTITPITNGATINLAALPTRRISIRAVATDDTESVKFKLDARKARTENIAPYALLGDDGDVYTPWRATVGSHTLRTTAYASDNARGTASAKKITFRLIDQPVTIPGEPEPEPEPQPDPQPPSGVTPPNIPGTWTLDWADEFNDNNLDGWNTSIWWRNGDGMGDETTSPNNVSVSDGTLNITATKSSTGAYTSGLVTTDNFKEFKYGYVEARMDIPSGIGFWPAFWMLPVNHDDGLGEIDIMEVVGGDPQLHVNYHIDGPGDDTESEHPGTDLFSGYHTYAVDWQQDYITWYIDGKQFHRSANFTHTPMYVILNLAVGGDWPGSPNSQTQFPSTLKVDYVRVWETAA